jgi:hypothetical protein
VRADASITELAEKFHIDPDGHEEARWRLGAGRSRVHGEDRSRADLQGGAAAAGGRDGSTGAANSEMHASTSWTGLSRN